MESGHGAAQPPGLPTKSHFPDSLVMVAAQSTVRNSVLCLGKVAE